MAELPVTITSNPAHPENGVYQVGSSLSLTCMAQGGHSPLTYSWNATCDGACFTLGKKTSSIGRDALHSTDGGNHTCMVTDYAGQSGSATVEIALSGSPCFYH